MKAKFYSDTAYTLFLEQLPDGVGVRNPVTLTVTFPKAPDNDLKLLAMEYGAIWKK